MAPASAKYPQETTINRPTKHRKARATHKTVQMPASVNIVESRSGCL